MLGGRGGRGVPSWVGFSLRRGFSSVFKCFQLSCAAPPWCSVSVKLSMKASAVSALQAFCLLPLSCPQGGSNYNSYWRQKAAHTHYPGLSVQEDTLLAQNWILAVKQIDLWKSELAKLDQRLLHRFFFFSQERCFAPDWIWAKNSSKGSCPPPTFHPQ